jgi:hypothetical protein
MKLHIRHIYCFIYIDMDHCKTNCEKGLASLPQEIRRWLKSAKMEEVDQRPMGRLQNQTSQDRYANYWKRLICYSLRVARNEQAESPSRLEDVESHDEDGDESDESEEDREGYSSEEDGAETRPIVRGDKMKDARRLFPWRDGQKEQATRLINCVETGTGSVTSAVLDFSRSFIFHKVYHKPFGSPMLLANMIRRGLVYESALGMTAPRPNWALAYTNLA